jgi:cytochrome c peroxidase
MKRVSVFLLLVVVFFSCSKDDNSSNDNGSNPVLPSITQLDLPDVPFNYENLALPNHYNRPPLLASDNTPNNNPVTNEAATLGRVLFYDKQLSLNNTIACASCHNQEDGFSDPLQFSDGFLNGKTGRHSMSLANSRYYSNGNFFWDERANSLEDQVLLPIQDAVEMGMTLDSLIQKLQNVEYYSDLFTYAFGDDEINSNRISRALAQFIRSMVSYQSKYDVGRAQVNAQNQDFPNFSTAENNGKRLFLSGRLGCAACHGTDAFIAPGSRNNGLDLTTTDPGVGGVTNNNNDDGEFKVGSLKNISLTAPYMHDGRFSTLREVVEHYNSGVQAHPNLSPPLRLPNGQARVLNLSETEKDDLIAFLHTLTDDVMVADEKYSDPFN